MDEAEDIGVRGALVALGLGTPFRRAFVVGTLVGIVAFTAGLPKSAFTEDGYLRPQVGLSKLTCPTRQRLAPSSPACHLPRQLDTAVLRL